MTDARRAIGLIALFALFAPGVNAARAQRLTGVVRDSALQAPLAGAVVSVLDASRAALSSTITDETGRYSLAVVPAAAQLRVVHIGFQPRVFALPRGASFDITLLRLPTLLTGLAVNDERVCSSDRDRRGALSLWEQARAALLASIVAREAQPATAMLARYERVMDTTLLVARQATEVAVMSTTRAFNTGAAPRLLAEHGYTEMQNGTMRYMAPDADVLLDESFAETHCFSVQSPDAEHPGAIGLSFEPAKGRDKLVDVRGTLWMTTAGTPMLETIEFRYTGDESLERFGAAGWSHFRTMTNGVVFVDRWGLRLPVVLEGVQSFSLGGLKLEQRAALVTHKVSHLGGNSETGGVVLSATWPSDLHYDAGLDALRGVVTTSDGRTPLAGALVIIRATGDTVPTDSAGRFEISPILPGQYAMLAVDTAFAAYLPPRMSVTRLDLTSLQRSEARFTIPSRLEAIAKVCGKAQPEGTGLIVGRVRDRTSARMPPKDVRLQAAWLPTGKSEREGETVSFDESGRFSICAVPRDLPVQLSLMRNDGEYADSSIVLAADSAITAIDWRVDVAALDHPVPPTRALLQGRVTRLATGAPLPNADVWIATLNRRATTDSAGAFTVGDLPPGKALIQVRSVGYQMRRDTMTLAAGAINRMEFALTPQSVLLDTIRTVAAGNRVSPGLRGFEERRLRHAEGYFVSDSALRKKEGRRLGNVLLADLGGIQLIPGRGGETYVTSTRRPCAGGAMGGCARTGCLVTIYMDGALLYMPGFGEAFNINEIQVDQLAGVEFYRSGATAPPQYNITGSGCGTLLLWTRDQ